MLLPKSMGGQEVALVDYAKACEALAWADASTAWFVNQSNVSMATSAASMPHEAAAAMFDRSLCRPGLGRAPRQEQGDPRRGRLSADRHLELRQRRAPHQDAGRPQRRAEPRRHAAHPLRPAGRPLVRLPAQPGQDHRRLARARAARHRQRQLLGRGPVHSRRARAGARRRRRAARAGADLSHRLDLALRQRLLQRHHRHRAPHARHLRDGGQGPAQPRLADGHGQQPGHPSRDGDPGGASVGHARLPA